MDGRPLEVFLTVDVEHAGSSHARARPAERIPPRSLDCRAGNEAFGLPYIVSALGRRGLKATFFTETLSAHYFGNAPMAAAVRTLVEAGQDVQLHAHPAWLRFADGRERPDRLHAFGAAEQEAVLREAKRILMEAGAPEPRAFRAGGFGADDRTYGALARLGFTVSSSYNLSALGGDCRIAERGRRNQAFKVEASAAEGADISDGLVEVPLTVYSIRDPRRGFRRAERHLQVGAVRIGQARDALEGAWRAGMRTAVILLHNFEFVRRRTATWFLEPFEAHKGVMAGFESLLDFLAAHPDRFTVRAFGELDAAWRKAVPAGAGGDTVPEAGGFYWPV